MKTDNELRLSMASQEYADRAKDGFIGFGPGQSFERGYLEGFRAALETFGIWKGGTQVIGCMDTPIKEAFQKCFPLGARE